MLIPPLMGRFLLTSTATTNMNHQKKVSEIDDHQKRCLKSKFSKQKHKKLAFKQPNFLQTIKQFFKSIIFNSRINPLFIINPLLNIIYKRKNVVAQNSGENSVFNSHYNNMTNVKFNSPILVDTFTLNVQIGFRAFRNTK